MNQRLMTSLTLAAVLALLPACVTKAKYEQLKASRDALALQNSELTAQTRRMAAVGAKMSFALELQEMELEKLRQAKRERGDAGHPTKRNRRLIQRFTDGG